MEKIEVTTTCRRCGEEWTPLHIDFVRGVWRVCPLCREDEERKDHMHQPGEERRNQEEEAIT